MVISSTVGFLSTIITAVLTTWVINPLTAHVYLVILDKLFYKYNLTNKVQQNLQHNL